MENKVLFKIGGFSVDTKTLLTIGGVIAGIAVIKKLSEKSSSQTVVVTEEETSSFANYVDEDFFGYVDEDFMGLHGGDESMKFGGGREIAFANANGTDNAIYEPNFYNSDAQVPIATDEPNFANTDGVDATSNMPQVAAGGIFGRKRRRKAADLDGSILTGSKRKVRAKKTLKPAPVPAPIRKRRIKGQQPVAMPPVAPYIMGKRRG